MFQYPNVQSIYIKLYVSQSVCHVFFYWVLSISALGVDRDLGFSRGHQGHRSPDDNDDNEEDDDVVEDTDEVEDNNKDDNNYKDISARDGRYYRYRYR